MSRSKGFVAKVVVEYQLQSYRQYFLFVENSGGQLSNSYLTRTVCFYDWLFEGIGGTFSFLRRFICFLSPTFGHVHVS